MPDDVMKWLVGAFLIPFILSQLKIFQMVRKLEKMHETPDAYGFGTVGLGKVISENTRAFIRMADCLEDMDIVLRWLAKKTDGSDPPPHIRKPHNHSGVG